MAHRWEFEQYWLFIFMCQACDVLVTYPLCTQSLAQWDQLQPPYHPAKNKQPQLDGLITACQAQVVVIMYFNFLFL